jgi:hypothetical protein
MDFSALRALLQHPKLLSEELSLRGANLGEEAALLLAESARLRELRDLDLRGNYLGDAATARLASSPYANNLWTLRLAPNNLGPRTARALVASPSLVRVTALDLSGNYLGNEGVRAFFEEQAPSAWRRVWRWLVTPRPQRPQPETPAAHPYRVALRPSAIPARGLPYLVSLDLSWNQIGPDGACVIAQSPRLARLRYLNLQANPLDEESVARLVSSPYASPYLHLNLLGSRVAPGLSRRLRNGFPGVLLL